MMSIVVAHSRILVIGWRSIFSWSARVCVTLDAAAQEFRQMMRRHAGVPCEGPKRLLSVLPK